MNVTVERIGGITGIVERIGGELTSSARRIGGIESDTERIGGIRTRAMRYGGIFCRMYQEVRGSVGGPYLEIDPTFLWVLAGQSTDNNVYSNTSWNVD